ncbi:inactive tyrosine-protein kinase 7-like [Limulus polyphemus]|uniref:Inactive tyrosine-protein kinase 7-like n=1 Tax=Limulus polyphemus TaxID=6850 RepID=A0ABM1SAA9_LIMPO|nr:inactive tyrosine-protein kinase 7-like [Limulus polyphemus]
MGKLYRPFRVNFLQALVAVWLAGKTLGQDSFYFNPHPKSRTVFSGQSVTLHCNVSNTQHIVFYWTLDNNPVANGTRRFQKGSNLHITRVDRHKDTGEFKCIATNVTTGISLASQGAQLDIEWISDMAEIQLHSPPKEEELVLGGEMVLRCKAEGSSNISYVWFHNGNKIFRNNRISIRHRRLQIDKLTLQDNGIYSCRGVNKAGVVTSANNFALRLKNKDAPQILKLPQDITAKKDDSAVFDCVYKNAVAVQWFFRNKDVPLTNSSRFTVYPNGSLALLRVRDGDEGIYRCVSVSASEDDPKQTYVAYLRVAFLRDITEDSFEPPVNPHEKTVVPRNGVFEIMCNHPVGHPKPRLWWEGPDGHVISDAGHVRVDDTRLIIDVVTMSDSGSYSCIAENLAGQKRYTIDLYVSVPPTIKSHPLRVQTDEGETAKIFCEYNGSPYPITSVHWLKNGKKIETSRSHYVVHPDNGTLFIHGVQLVDSGLYQCEVKTKGFPSIQSKNASFVVKEKLKFAPPPVSKNLELGSNAKIYCKARGAVPPTVRWTKEGNEYFKWPPHIKDENGTLYFTSVRQSDAGNYTCFATSTQAFINTTIHVEVIVLPTFTVRPAETIAYEGYPIMLHCKATGDPPPTIQWDKDNVLNGFDKKRFQVLENGTLYVSEAHRNDEGKYGCTAGNSGGFRRTEIKLVVQSGESYSPNQIGAGLDGNENTMTKTVTITLGAAAVYMVLVMGLMIWCRFRRARRKALLLAQATADVAKSENGDVIQNTELKDKNGSVRKDHRNGGPAKSDGEGHSHSSGSHSHHSKRSRSSYDRLQFPRHDLQTVMLLGRGEFGDVFLAKARGIRDNEAETLVMVKALHTRDENDHFEFKREMDIFHKLNHQNVVKLLGLCRDVEPFLMIVEYSDWGDLKQFLLATRKDTARKGPKPPPLFTSQIMAICHQVALGMESLSNHRFVHKDLATRNCLITSRLEVKISSPSLSRDTYAQEYSRYQFKNIPLRWAPAEAVLEDEWSTKSDVWSFAVFTWEVFMQAELPFANKGDDVILRLLRSHDLHWNPPEGSPQSLRNLLLSCWNISPKDRPTFSEIAMQIGEIKVDSKM